MNFFLIRTLYFTFSTYKVENKHLVPKDKPVIFVANHQGIFDIIGLAWLLREFHPKFVSKIELGKGIPSVSYNLQHGGSVLIDRKDPRQALPELKKMGEYIQNNSRSTVIFPEGTRTRNGQPKPFASNGLKILCKNAPDAWVVPVTINNSWRIFRYGNFPLGIAIGRGHDRTGNESVAVVAQGVSHVAQLTGGIALAVQSGIRVGT